MIVRVKASKDIKRLTDERNAAMQVRHIKKKNESQRVNIVEQFYFCLSFLSFSNLQEYSLIMSERDTFHKEMEKIQDEVQNSKGIMI